SRRECIRWSMMRPAAIAPPSGSNGETPRAISSAFTNWRMGRDFGSKSNAAVVLPAPLGPPMMTSSFVGISRRQIGDHGVEHGKAGERRPQPAARGQLDGAFIAQDRDASRIERASGEPREPAGIDPLGEPQAHQQELVGPPPPPQRPLRDEPAPPRPPPPP